VVEVVTWVVGGASKVVVVVVLVDETAVLELHAAANTTSATSPEVRRITEAGYRVGIHGTDPTSHLGAHHLPGRHICRRRFVRF